MRIAVAIAIASLGPVAVPAVSQPPSAHDHALAAGYKASFLCSGIFNAGQTPEEVAADDLTRIYPSYRPLIDALPAEIDRANRRVTVAWSETMPPRVAQWRPHLGCAQLPTGARVAVVDRLPRLPNDGRAADPVDTDALAWPQGDAGAMRELPDGERQALDAIIAAAFDRKSYGETTETTAIVIVEGGLIVGERHRDGYHRHRPQRTWSVAKSIAASVIAAAVEQGLVDLDDRVPIPAWQVPGDPRAAIDWHDLLHMSSGLWSPTAGNRTDNVYFGGMAVRDSISGLPIEAAPGTRWRYANNDTLLAMLGLRQAIGSDDAFLAFPYVRLLWPIGMTRTMLETDWRGDFILSSQVWTTARDLARLGLLYLDDGVWQGERILPEGWATYVATPAPDQPERDDGIGYGAQFWLFGPDQGLPPGNYAAMGNRGQYVVIVPARDVVIVRRGFDAVGESKNFDIARFAADILAGLGD